MLKRHKIELQKGRAFYQLTKSETVQDYKKLVVRRTSDGTFVTGAAVRAVLKIPKTVSCKVEVDAEELPDFEVFVQSTSHNRHVVADSKVLYRVSEDEEIEEDPDATVEKEEEQEVATATTRRGRKVKKRKVEKDVPSPPVAKKAAKAAKKDANGASGGVGGPVEIAFSFDTTGSMYACLGEVRRKVQVRTH